MILIPIIALLVLINLGIYYLYSGMAPVKAVNPALKYSRTLELIYAVGQFFVRLRTRSVL